ncbi:MAG: di-trans,poly-cis-decaprenylcistransferase [Candidatus Diapherotrites archaeon]|nr:di-trans,poly-cis-decaprenylcistransferase [Candidatus Diapherotrites archaeon]
MLNSIAFIPDGTRTYAKQNNLSVKNAYSLAVNNAWNILEETMSYKTINSGTYWALSTENFKRSKFQLQVLFKIFQKQLEKIPEMDFFENHGVKLNFIGQRQLLPNKIQKLMEFNEQKTADYGEKQLNIAIAYGGRTEIADACKQICAKVQNNELSINQINESTVKENLYPGTVDPDMIIRTKGVMRTSGFLPFQSAYSEYYFSKKLWPEFNKTDLKEAIEDFNSRKRNFGK